MGCQNNTAVAVSRFKPIQCIACRFLRWLYVSRVDLLSRGSFGKSDFHEKYFYNQLHAIPIVNWFLKVLSMPIPLYSVWQVYQTCSLGCCGHRRAVKKKKKKKKKKKSCFYIVCMFVFILTVSVSPTPMHIQTKINVSQHFPFLSFPFRKKKTQTYASERYTQ